MTKQVDPVNWNPFATNPLDWLHERKTQKLATPNGIEVTITKPGNDFIVTIGQNRTVTGSNVNTCYFLNYNEVGFAK
jgi:hypothetical protein